MRITADAVPGLKVTIMGLGLHGGGLASAEYFAGNGAEVTVTDLSDESRLRPTIEKLSGYPIRYVLGRHEQEDFSSADLVIKNPAVRPDSPFLKVARQVETDISIFLQIHRGPVFAVTGTKGKSTTATAMHHILRTRDADTLLGGNITVSPLSFGPESAASTVVLELSSWQLADLRGREVLRPQVAMLTNILRDHQNHYASMADYIADKMVIFEAQQRGQTAILNDDDPTVRSAETRSGVQRLFVSSKVLPAGRFGAYLEDGRGIYRTDTGSAEILGDLRLKGDHNRLNMLFAALACVSDGMRPADVVRAASEFDGVEHRLEYVARAKGVHYYNDSAATIPDATIAAARAFEQPVLLICGGTDKELDFDGFKVLERLAKLIYLLEGTATVKMIEVLQKSGISYKGPFPSLEKLIECIVSDAVEGDNVVFSPGCASFGMFANEFDRGRKYKAMVQELLT